MPPRPIPLRSVSALLPLLLPALVLSLLVGAFPGARAARAGELPIFDAHMHFSEGARDAFTPDRVMALMDAAGVARALVSSSPDDGTLALLDHAPRRIVAGFRPYRGSVGLGNWHRSADALAYSRDRLGQGRHAVFGEVHLARPDDVEGPLMADFVRLIRDTGLYLHVHCDAAVVEALFARWPDLRVLWAHAGFSEPADAVGRALDRHRTLWTEVSYRAQDIMPGPEIDPRWRALLVRHADRFLVGTDTWETDRWHRYEAIIGAHRRWLGELPPDAAARIANGNARRLFGPAGGR